MEETILGIEIPKLVIISYFCCGALFMFYSLVVFIQTSLIRVFRYSVSILYFVWGLFLFNLAGKLIVDHDRDFSIFVIVNAIILSVAGFLSVKIIIDRRGKITEKQQK